MGNEDKLAATLAAAFNLHVVAGGESRLILGDARTRLQRRKGLSRSERSSGKYRRATLPPWPTRIAGCPLLG